MIPSATLEHSNVSIGAHETRYSFTQYSAGGIFRYIDDGYQTVKACVAGLDGPGKKLRSERLSKKLEEGLALYSTISELEDMVKDEET